MTVILGADHATAGAMTERRRDLVRRDISRAAAALFAERGLAATSGEQIADAVGLSVRTLWRYFRTKESCAEPILVHGVADQLAIMQRWPTDTDLETHLAGEFAARQRRADPQTQADDRLSVKLVALADTEPAIRATWLLACDQIEQGLVDVFTARTGSNPTDAPGAATSAGRQLSVHAAAACAAIRAVNEDLCRDLHDGHLTRADGPDLSRRLGAAVLTATGGAFGSAVGDDTIPKSGRQS